jgi:plasmid stabilization system protein ParE
MAIWSYIADDSEDAADRFVDLLAGSFGNLGRNPSVPT